MMDDVRDLPSHHDTLRLRRVVLVSATFQLKRSYQENIWAESLADMGYEVTVCAPAKDTDQVGLERVMTMDHTSFEVVYVPAFILPNNNVFTRELPEVVLSRRPDLVIWFGAVMYFGRALYLDDRLKDIPVITVYSLSRRGRHPFCWYGRAGSWRERAKSLAFQLLRAPVLTRSLRRAQLTIANTPECTDIIRQYVWGEERVMWAQKHTEIPLGFCPHTFTYQPVLRRQARAALSLSEYDVVLLFSTRFAPDKWPAIEQCYYAVELCMSACAQLNLPQPYMTWVGADHDATTQRFRALIERSAYSDRHHLITFQTRERLATWYHTADVILFPQPSISVQEALGTGAHIVCPPDPSLNHLREYMPSIDYAPLDRWPELLTELCQRIMVQSEERDQERVNAALNASALSYPQLIREALRELEKRL